MTSNPITIRQAGPDDFAAVAALLRSRDDRQHPSQAVIDYVFRLDPQMLVGWVAYDGERPVALNTLYLRELRWGDKVLRAGYWAHLFVEEAYRKAMVYPQLVLTMLRSIKELGLDMIYTGTRRQHVAESHVKLGSVQVGTLPVLIKPLRPGRLVARHKGWSHTLQSMAGLVDPLYRAALALRRPSDANAQDMDPTGDAAEHVAQLLNEQADGRVSMVWSPQMFARRFAGTIEGWKYHLLTSDARDGQTPAAAVLWRQAERSGINVGVVMDVLHKPGAADEARRLLGEVERRAIVADCDLMCWLDGAGAATGNLLRGAGYRMSSETYYVLVWPKTLLTAPSPGADLKQWRFTFSDHDAF